MIDSLEPRKRQVLWLIMLKSLYLSAPLAITTGNYPLLFWQSWTQIRRYFKIARQRFAVDDTKMLVLCIEHWTISSSYRNIKVFEQCFHSDGCWIEWYDIPDRTVYRPSIVLSFDTRYIEVSWYHEVSRYHEVSIYQTFTSIVILRYIEYRTSTN